MHTIENFPYTRFSEIRADKRKTRKKSFFQGTHATADFGRLCKLYTTETRLTWKRPQLGPDDAKYDNSFNYHDMKS